MRVKCIVMISMFRHTDHDNVLIPVESSDIIMGILTVIITWTFQTLSGLIMSVDLESVSISNNYNDSIIISKIISIHAQKITDFYNYMY